MDDPEKLPFQEGDFQYHLSNQIQLYRELKSQASRLFRLKIAVIGLLLTGISIAIPVIIQTGLSVEPVVEWLRGSLGGEEVRLNDGRRLLMSTGVFYLVSAVFLVVYSLILLWGQATPDELHPYITLDNKYAFADSNEFASGSQIEILEENNRILNNMKGKIRKVTLTLSVSLGLIYVSTSTVVYSRFASTQLVEPLSIALYFLSAFFSSLGCSDSYYSGPEDFEFPYNIPLTVAFFIFILLSSAGSVIILSSTPIWVAVSMISIFIGFWLGRYNNSG